MRASSPPSDLAGLRQTHCDAFDGFLRGLFKSVGKSPKDKDRSIRELRRISEAKKPNERGLEAGTRNRHLTFLGQALVRARKAGVVIDSGVSLTEFRARKKKRGRDQRPTPPSSALEVFFSLPIFTGCRGWSDIHIAGPELFHRGAYFGPMLAHYGGMRREEFCALSVEDVVTSNGDPFRDAVAAENIAGLRRHLAVLHHPPGVTAPAGICLGRASADRTAPQHGRHAAR